MALATQLLSVAVYSAAQEVAEALGLSVAANPRYERRPRWAARGVTLGEPLGTGVSSHRDHDGL